LLKCGHCGGAITAEEHIKTSGRRYVYYRCSRRKVGVTCREKALSEAEILAQVSRRFRFLTMPEKVHRWLCRQRPKQ
jgi:hypothetical protein